MQARRPKEIVFAHPNMTSRVQGWQTTNLDWAPGLGDSNPVLHIFKGDHGLFKSFCPSLAGTFLASFACGDDSGVEDLFKFGRFPCFHD